MGTSGSMSLAAWVGIVVGGLIAVALVAGSIKLYMNKQRLKKNTKIVEMQAAKSTDREELVRGGKKFEVGDLVGARALEPGYIGGVAQSRPSSPTPSYVLAPSAQVVNWSKNRKPGSSSSSLVDYPPTRNGSVISLSLSLNQTQRKPSPLRLQPSDVELSGRRSHDPASVGGIGGAYMPPLPSPRSNRSVTPCADTRKPENWINPLDVHFSRPSTPVSSSRRTSSLPRNTFSEDVPKSSLLVATPPRSVVAPKSAAASMTRNEVSAPPPPAPAPASIEAPKVSPTFSIFPQMPSRAARQSGRSIFPVDDDSQRPSSRRSLKESKFDIRPVPLENLPPQLASIDPNLFPQDTRRWNPSSPVIRDSIVSKQRVSIYRPTHSHEEPQDGLKAHARSHSVAASSIYSTRTSIVDEPQDSNAQSLTRSRSRDAGGRTRSRSSHKRSSSSQRLSRTRDSLRRHDRKQSEESIKSTKRRSRQRDQLYFDPTSTSRNRSGSIQGRKVDFDHPRESPFSNSNAISSHSANTSISSSISSHSTRPTGTPQEPVPKLPSLAIKNTDSERLSMNTTTGRNRSASEASQGSIGEFYDAYYRQSILAQRVSVAAQANAALNLRSSGLLIPGRRPPPGPLRLGPGSVGGIGLSGETIMELPSPGPSLRGRGQERFPKMINGGRDMI